MISAARILGLAVIGAALLGVETVAAPANAQPACKNERVKAESEGRIRGEGFAKNEAKQRWEKIAEERFGKAYGKWANAKDTDVECESVKSKRLGLPASLCVAFGRPCAGGADTTVTEERERNRADGPGRVRDRDTIIVDEDDRRDRKRARDRDDDRWLRAERRYSYRRAAYEDAMSFQDHLARKRRLVEMRRYRHEMGYWRYRQYWD